MTALKRTLAALALLLGAVGLLLSLSVAVGVWVVQGPATAKAARVFGRIDAALDAAEQGLGQAKASLARAAARLESARDEQRKLSGAEPQPNSAVRRIMARTVQQKVGPEVGNAKDKLHAVAEAAVVANAVLEDLSNLPFLSVSGLDLDRLTQMNGQLADVGPAVWELSRLLGEPGPGADGELSKIERGLQALRRLVEEYEPQVAQARQRAESLRARTMPWVIPAAAGVSVAALWVAVSQASVVAHALAWWKRAGRGPARD